MLLEHGIPLGTCTYPDYAHQRRADGVVLINCGRYTVPQDYNRSFNGMTQTNEQNGRRKAWALVDALFSHWYCHVGT
jgi:hypothetical protein